MNLFEKNRWQVLSLLKKKIINSDDNRVDQLRIIIIMLGFSCFFVILIVKLSIITLFPIVDAKTTGQTSNIAIWRNEITDRNGVLLAVNLNTASLYANPKIIFNPKDVALKLISVLPQLNHDQLIKDLSSTKSFIWIKRNLTPREQQAVNSIGIPGLFFEKAQQRVYTHGPLLAHILGYVGLDNRGLAGIEKYYDDKLIQNNDEIINKTPLVLSIDVRVQNIVAEELIKSIEEFKAIGAVGIIMEANTGELISSVSLPSYDPHNPAAASKDQLFNRFSLGLYEPGSTFKIFTLAMALDSQTVDLHNTFNVESPIKAARFSITDYRSRHGGYLSVPEIFMHSSNIGTAKISLELGKKKQQQFLKSFGLLDRIMIELPERATPLYPQDKRWSDISTMTISYGHGIAVTPLHLVRATAAMVNGGNLPNLTLIKDNIKPTTSIISKDSSNKMQKLFRLVVEYGTGKKANTAGYLVGGKTGTADKNERGIYNRNSRLSSFIGAFPIIDPKYIILVMLDEPKGNQSTGGYATAGMTAAPTTRKIISRIGPLLGMETIDEQDQDIKQKLWLDYHETLNNDNSSL